MLTPLTWVQPKMCCLCKTWVTSGWQEARKCPGGYCLDQYCDECGKAAGAISEDAPSVKRRVGPVKAKASTELSPLEQCAIDMEDLNADED